jgi:hypothetical protein
MGRVRIALAIGLALIVVAICLTLTQAPLSLARRNNSEDTILGSARRSGDDCQSNEVLPRGTSAIRLHVFAEYGPKVTLTVLEHGRVIARGQQDAGWTGGAVTVPVRALPASRSPVELCFALLLNGDETLQLLGEPVPAARATREGRKTLAGRLSVEYLRPGRSSWWSLVPAVARNAGLGRAASGAWSVALVGVLMGGVLLLCSGLIVRELR